MSHSRSLRRTFRTLSISFMALGSLIYGLAFLFVLLGFSGNAVFPVDCGVVFGAAVRVRLDDRGDIVYTGPGPGILRRVGTAAELYRAGSIKRLFVTGGTGEGMVDSEAEVMRRQAVVRGVLNEDIVMEDQSHSTWQNLINTQPLAKECRGVVAISDRYHLARIRLQALQLGWNVYTYPASPTAGRWFELHSAAREAAGILFTILFPTLT